MAEELDATLAKHDVIVFSYGGCPYCRKVTRAFGDEGVAHVEIDYDELDDGDAVRSEIRRRHKQRSVPAVFVKGNSWGGATTVPNRGWARSRSSATASWRAC